MERIYDNQFTEGIPNEREATRVTAKWFNEVQETLIHPIQHSGQELNREPDQLTIAIKKLSRSESKTFTPINKIGDHETGILLDSKKAKIYDFDIETNLIDLSDGDRGGIKKENLICAYYKGEWKLKVISKTSEGGNLINFWMNKNKLMYSMNDQTVMDSQSPESYLTIIDRTYYR